VLPYWRKVIVTENRVEDMDSLGQMLQSPVRDTIRALSLAELKAPNGFIDLFRVCQLWFAGMGLEARIQRHVNHLNNNRDRMNCNGLELSFQTVSKGFSFLIV
jgi:hypothetical protein